MRWVLAFVLPAAFCGLVWVGGFEFSVRRGPENAALLFIMFFLSLVGWLTPQVLEGMLDDD